MSTSDPAPDIEQRLDELARQADAAGEHIRSTVREHGWAAVGVDGPVPFTYTAGLWALADHPELIIVGLPAETAKWVLDQAVERITQGHPMAAGTTIHGLIGEYPAAVRAVDAQRLPLLAFAADLYRGLVFTAVQLVWPDRAGKFPWERAAQPDFRRAQPLLFSTSRFGLGRRPPDNL